MDRRAKGKYRVVSNRRLQKTPGNVPVQGRNSSGTASGHAVSPDGLMDDDTEIDPPQSHSQKRSAKEARKETSDYLIGSYVSLRSRSFSDERGKGRVYLKAPTTTQQCGTTKFLMLTCRRNAS